MKGWGGIPGGRRKKESESGIKESVVWGLGAEEHLNSRMELTKEGKKRKNRERLFELRTPINI